MMGPGTCERVRKMSVEQVKASRPSKYGLVVAGVLITLGGFGDLEPPVSAASAKSQKEVKQPEAQPLAANRPTPAMPLKVEAKKLPRTESNESVAEKSQLQTPSDRASRKIRRPQKAGTKLRPPAIVQPKPNFSHYGLLQQPQRYDPSRDRRTGRAPNPQAGELLHDHFQELDKNHDGMIDPFERTFGRLDIDRDLSNRQWE